MPSTCLTHPWQAQHQPSRRLRCLYCLHTPFLLCLLCILSPLCLLCHRLRCRPSRPYHHPYLPCPFARRLHLPQLGSEGASNLQAPMLPTAICHGYSQWTGLALCLVLPFQSPTALSSPDRIQKITIYHLVRLSRRTGSHTQFDTLNNKLTKVL